MNKAVFVCVTFLLACLCAPDCLADDVANLTASVTRLGTTADDLVWQWNTVLPSAWRSLRNGETNEVSRWYSQMLSPVESGDVTNVSLWVGFQGAVASRFLYDGGFYQDTNLWHRLATLHAAYRRVSLPETMESYYKDAFAAGTNSVWEALQSFRRFNTTLDAPAKNAFITNLVEEQLLTAEEVFPCEGAQ